MHHPYAMFFRLRQRGIKCTQICACIYSRVVLMKSCIPGLRFEVIFPVLSLWIPCGYPVVEPFCRGESCVQVPPYSGHRSTLETQRPAPMTLIDNNPIQIMNTNTLPLLIVNKSYIIYPHHIARMPYKRLIASRCEHNHYVRRLQGGIPSFFLHGYHLPL